MKRKFCILVVLIAVFITGDTYAQIVMGAPRGYSMEEGYVPTKQGKNESEYMGGFRCGDGFIIDNRVLKDFKVKHLGISCYMLRPGAQGDVGILLVERHHEANINRVKVIPFDFHGNRIQNPQRSEPYRDKGAHLLVIRTVEPTNLVRVTY